jgi:predicted phosphodiesterase
VRVAALYDVHGNLPALDAVLAEVPDDAAIVLGGDHVYGPFPVETLARLGALGARARWLRGNTDREQLEIGAGEGAHDVLVWVGERLTESDVRFLHGLPPTLELDGVLFCHATPRSDHDRFDAGTPEDAVAGWFADVAAATVVCGHTHRQFDRTIAGRRVVNAGSVGMPHEDEPGAYWALLDDGEVELRRTGYDPGPLRAVAGYPRPWWDGA